MNFELLLDVQRFLRRLDVFIEDKIAPLQRENDRFFDYRRKTSRTDWNNHGLPHPEWESLLRRVRKLADDAGVRRTKGSSQPNLYMCAIRYHLTVNHGGGLGLANDLQNEHSVVANDPITIMLHHYGSEVQRSTLIPAAARGEFRATFGLTEVDHGSDATFIDTTATRVSLDDGQLGYEITGNKMWQTGSYHATIFFKAVRVPDTAILGPVDDGLEIA
ncbi:uncharacterized protein Z518_04634 [Rhinocladiella mackenziei CBS 650.93]|uniref:Acyl-CoA dehydrogenase n=1 Tax=Rhinocladiella mackenziei CBS 650.93 TaxID=1442369 RepID=A0A0D2H899_9EURO|nr:uncharacterized protein Z518_04634 [Rhinocladiella mackenziei CBS 650.93]KIX06658.1 hypothetical protein Z518_04634 [Rhinocladiella mackenziei CBS 650.93]